MDDKDKEVRWVASDLWHVTVQFLGDLSEPEKHAVVEFLGGWTPPEEWRAVELRVEGVGAFPAVEHARVLWLGIRKNQSLVSAQSHLAQEMEALGFPHDEREYTPHITLARFRNPRHASDLVGLGGRKHFGDYKVEELVLMQSVLQGNMTKYIPVFRKTI
jgi:2'-5' RNA ligase